MPPMARWQLWSSWALQIVVAIVLLQTLFFKFTGASESVYIFTRLGMEPWGRLASGGAELVAGVLMLVPGYATAGAALALVVILGAIGAHLTVLGIEVQGDGGLLFALALVVLLASLGVLALRWHEVPAVFARMREMGIR